MTFDDFWTDQFSILEALDFTFLKINLLVRTLSQLPSPTKSLIDGIWSLEVQGAHNYNKKLRFIFHWRPRGQINFLNQGRNLGPHIRYWVAKWLKRHIFGFPTKNLTILDQYFRFHCLKKIFVLVQYLAQLRYYKYIL